MEKKSSWMILTAFILLIAQGFYSQLEGHAMSIQISSSAFHEGEMIPEEYTCDGKNISPPLSFTNIPEKAVSLVLICDDPDAPVGIWVHWVLFDLPAQTKQLDSAIPPLKELPGGGSHGINDFKKLGYGGPCPPSGVHRYFFKIYALDKKLNLSPGASKKDIETAMSGHVLAQGQLMGRYKRR